MNGNGRLSKKTDITLPEEDDGKARFRKPSAKSGRLRDYPLPPPITLDFDIVKLLIEDRDVEE